MVDFVIAQVLAFDATAAWICVVLPLMAAFKKTLPVARMRPFRCPKCMGFWFSLAAVCVAPPPAQHWVACIAAPFFGMAWGVAINLVHNGRA